MSASFEIQLAKVVKAYKGKTEEEITTDLPEDLVKLATAYIQEEFGGLLIIPQTAEEDLRTLAEAEEIAKTEDDYSIRKHIKSITKRYVSSLSKHKEMVKNPTMLSVKLGELFGLKGLETATSTGERSVVPDGNALVVLAITTVIVLGAIQIASLKKS